MTPPSSRPGSRSDEGARRGGCGRGRVATAAVWLRLASYFNQGIAFHEYPDVPPYPASHGCVRVPAPDARRVYDFASIGTAVVVY